MQKRYNIKIHKRVDKFLASHPEMQKPFFQALHVLAEDIHTREIDVKSLSGLSGNHYRIRIGKYRFLYEVLEDTICIFVYNAGSRGDIYK